MCELRPLSWSFRAAAALIASLSSPASAQPAPPCLGGTIELRQGASLDYGMTGLAHDRDLVAGAKLGFAVVRRCSGDSQVCHTNTDCGEDECVATCDCETDPSCEITGPIAARRCVSDLSPCIGDEDCSSGSACVAMSSPPIPLVGAGVPTCTVSFFEEPLTGTVDVATGQLELATALRWRVMLGILLEQPCPRCGAPDEDPRVGESFTCEGGPFSGNSCRVDGVSGSFGGVSYDCPPNLAANISGPGVAIRLDDVTTGVVSRTATLPCANFAFRSNPLNAPANPGKCLDDQSACTSNADCRRCSEDASIACDDDGDCTGNGACAEAPDQPISCGFWCHCGFCDGDALQPCFDTIQCAEGKTCQVGPGLGAQSNVPQQRPNDCGSDLFRCGTGAGEQCATTTVSTCSDDPFRPCDVNADCASGGCVAAPQSCFESRIVRSGAASSSGSYCGGSGEPCATDDDCAGGAGSCIEDAIAPELAAVFCSGGTSSAAINAGYGITGPAALSLPVLVKACRCEGEEPGCEAFCTCASAGEGDPCDDGDPCTANDTCSGGACTSGEPVCTSTTTTTAQPAACGDWNGDEELTASDAQGVLQAAVGIHACALQVCDYDGSGATTANDALAVLRASVGLPSSPFCPA